MKGEPEEITANAFRVVDTSIRQLLPSDIDAEKGLISAWMAAPTRVAALARVRGASAEWMHYPAHRLIYAALEEMTNSGQAIDIITMTAWLRDRKQLIEAGGHAGISAFSMTGWMMHNAEQYLEIVEVKHTLRQVIATCDEYKTRAYEDQDDVPGLMGEMEARVLSITSRRTKSRNRSQGESVMAILDMLESDDEAALWGLSTGFPNLDLMARGARPANMIGIGGDMKAGKTALAQNLIDNMCVRSKTPASVLFISLENDAQEVNEEMLQIGSGFNLDDIRAARKGESARSIEIMRRVAEAATRLAKAPLTILDDESLNMLQIRSIARELKPRIIVIDYLQLLNGIQRRYERDDLRIAENSRHCKLMLKETGATGYILSQLTDGKAAGSRAIVKDCNQWWIVGDANDAADEKTIRICAGRRVGVDEVKMRWIGSIKKMLPMAV